MFGHNSCIFYDMFFVYVPYLCAGFLSLSHSFSYRIFISMLCWSNFSFISLNIVSFSWSMGDKYYRFWCLFYSVLQPCTMKDFSSLLLQLSIAFYKYVSSV